MKKVMTIAVLVMVVMAGCDLSDHTRRDPLPAELRWHVSSEISKLDDSENVRINVCSNDYYGSCGGQIIAQCHEGKTRVTLYVTSSYSGHYLYPRATYRIDREKARTTSSIMVGSQARSFLKRLIGHRSIYVVNNANERNFTLVGAEQAITRLRGACNW